MDVHTHTLKDRCYPTRKLAAFVYFVLLFLNGVDCLRSLTQKPQPNQKEESKEKKQMGKGNTSGLRLLRAVEQI
ncbi:hypothetical protein BDV23DRAFT_91941 [Aspergillus alliaceus]|uniref:Uncharacterized protein n=1 Tax=Petromyces alliaceus TaxID=209559 RepID=A0A5N7C8I1_PETAA|nr:hypothetical protein BDV23DRAFT_91941 [Aspergillus alliaceus]